MKDKSGGNAFVAASKRVLRKDSKKRLKDAGGLPCYLSQLLKEYSQEPPGNYEWATHAVRCTEWRPQRGRYVSSVSDTGLAHFSKPRTTSSSEFRGTFSKSQPDPLRVLVPSRNSQSQNQIISVTVCERTIDAVKLCEVEALCGHISGPHSCSRSSLSVQIKGRSQQYF